MPSRILVTDDDPATLTFYGELLEDAGYTYVLHAGPHPDVAEVAQVAPDLMLQDWVVGDQTAYQTLSNVRHAPGTAHIPIIVCSAAGTQIHAYDAWFAEEGIVLLEKPFDIDVLLARLAAMLNGASA